MSRSFDEKESLTPKMSLVSPSQFDYQHVFHFECLEQYFSENTRCPICNLDYSKQSMSMLRKLDSEREDMNP